MLISILPGMTFQYEYNIPPDHPSGTFWYHTHLHGSTALQVSSGMAGVLIVKGDRLPTTDSNGDIDTLLAGLPEYPALPGSTDRKVLFQQIAYYCDDPEDPTKIHKNDDGIWRCDPDQVGHLETHTTKGGDSVFGPRAWGQSGRYTSVNGLVLPIILSRVGQVERWRLIHGGVRDTISLEFRPLLASAPSLEGLTASETAAYVDEFCSGDPVPYQLIAADGLTMAQAQETTLTTLQPAYCNDALVVFPTAGAYCVIDASAPEDSSINVALPRRLVGVVMAEGEGTVADVAAYVTEQLVAAAEMTMPASVKDKVIADLKDGLKFDKFIPHRTIEASELGDNPPQRTVNFDIDTDRNAFLINGQTFSPDRIDQQLTLGDVEEWMLTSSLANHPFHIHIDPFQIDRIIDSDGNDVSGNVADGDDPQYRNMKGVWKDTILVKQGYTVYVRSRYQRYIGTFVLHCHILDHEDQGMMQIVNIGLGSCGLSH